jgi:hypothetical protein
MQVCMLRPTYEESVMCIICISYPEFVRPWSWDVHTLRTLMQRVPLRVIIDRQTVLKLWPSAGRWKARFTVVRCVTGEYPVVSMKSDTRIKHLRQMSNVKSGLEFTLSTRTLARRSVNVDAGIRNCRFIRLSLSPQRGRLRSHTRSVGTRSSKRRLCTEEGLLRQSPRLDQLAFLSMQSRSPRCLTGCAAPG